MGLSLNRLKVILERRKQINFHRVLRVLPRQMCMDHFLVLIGLFIIIPCYINGQTDSIPTAIAATTAPYTGCKTSETHSPPSVYCNAYCGDDIPTVIEQVCDSRKKRSKTGLTLSDISFKKDEASKFLYLPRNRIHTKRSQTDIVVECCDEKCVVEEINEYC